MRLGPARDFGLLAKAYNVGCGWRVGRFPHVFGHPALIVAARGVSAAEEAAKRGAG